MHCGLWSVSLHVAFGLADCCLVDAYCLVWCVWLDCFVGWYLWLLILRGVGYRFVFWCFVVAIVSGGALVFFARLLGLHLYLCSSELGLFGYWWVW